MSELMNQIAAIQDAVEKVATELIFLKTEVWELEHTLSARDAHIEELTDALAAARGEASNE